jgi:hypothetical protein
VPSCNLLAVDGDASSNLNAVEITDANFIVLALLRVRRLDLARVRLDLTFVAVVVVAVRVLETLVTLRDPWRFQAGHIWSVFWLSWSPSAHNEWRGDDDSRPIDDMQARFFMMQEEEAH